MNQREARFTPLWLSWLLGVGLLCTIAVRFAQPLIDGDLFWHIAYGEQMIRAGSLRTNHELYSWMPVSPGQIYCAWTGELLLYFLWKTMGSMGVFVLRYACVLSVAGLLGWSAWRRQKLSHPFTWLVMLMAILASAVATYPKPEMLSLVLWNIMVFSWFEGLRTADSGRSAIVWIYALPALLLIWVNSHGGFVLAAPFLAVIAVVAFWRLPGREARHLWIALACCAVAPAINPYGLHYPAQLVKFLLNHRPDLAWNNAFQATWSAAGKFHHFPELLGWMTLALVAAVSAAPRQGMVVGLLFLVYLPVYLIYVRATFLLPALFGFGVLSLETKKLERAWANWLAVGLFVFLAGRTAYESKFRPEPDSWLGFGIGYSQPVTETEFLAKASFGRRLYNTYNVGGYLLWRLYPRNLVMVDARSFPYVGWFDELYQFTRTQDPKIFRGFLQRHPADAALVDFAEDAVWQSFLATPGWRPVFYGPCGAVYVANGKNLPVQPSPLLLDLKNAATGLRVFRFARAVGDYPTAWRILEQLEGPLRRQIGPEILLPLEAYREGHDALRAGNFPLAWEKLSRSFQQDAIVGQDNTLLLIVRALTKGGASEPKQTEALKAGLARLLGENP